MTTLTSVNGISGKLLPTEKNHEATLQAISNCVVDSLTEDGTTQLLQEYQLQDIQDLKTAIYDNLESEYAYVKELQTTTGAEIAPKISLLSRSLPWISLFLK